MTESKSPEIAIIRTRLAPPRIGSAPVTRDELLQRLDSLRHCKLSLVLGPAGSGKTMLLAQWRRQLAERGAAVAWYNLAADDDVTQVGTYIVESLRSAKLDIRDDELQLFNRSGGQSRKSFIASLIDDLIECNKEVYLIIDDLHHGTAFSVFQLLDELLDALPDNARLVIGSRTRPPLNLPRLQAQDLLSELSFKDLRFNLEEARRFVAAQGLAQLGPAHIRRLHEMSDGWAAGLQLLLFSLRKETHVEHFFERHASKPAISQEAALVGYLESTVADHVSSEELDFLCSISVCRRFNRKLCEVLSGNADAAGLLRKFVDEHLFLLQIDTADAEPWFRFHRLFESFLHSRLQRRDKNEIKALYLKAARWFAEQRLYFEALRYASEAADYALMTELIDRSARRMSAEGQFRQLIRWCAQIPAEQLQDRLNVSLNLAWAQISCGQFRAFNNNIEKILLNPAHQEGSIHCEVQVLRAYGYAAADDTAASLGILEPMLKIPPPENAFLRSLISVLAATGLVYAGHFTEAREALRTFYRHLPRGHNQRENLLADAVVGHSYLYEGRIREALAHLIPFRDKVVLPGKVGPDAIGNLIGPLCDALYQYGLLDEARELIESYAEVIAAAELPEGILNAYRVRARLELTTGNTQAAFETLQRLEELGFQRQLDRLVAWSLYDQFRLSLHAQLPSSAKEALDRLEQLAEKYAGEQRCALAEIPMIAAMAVAANAVYRKMDIAECLSRIESAEHKAQALGRAGIGLHLGFMRCLARLDAGKQKHAVAEGGDLLGKAVELGQRRVVADLGPHGQPLARLLISRARDEEERQILEIACKGEGASANDATTPEPGAVAPLAEPLTAREQEILELLGRGLSAKSIGRSLDISPTTAKWHLKNLYGKLGASSREDALSKARQSRIIG